MEKSTENSGKTLPPSSSEKEKATSLSSEKLPRKKHPSPVNSMENTMTLSTKRSTDKLICKSPKESPSCSIADKTSAAIFTSNRVLMVLGVVQFILGFLMVLFGMYVIVYKASLSQIGGGIWGGIIAMITGVAGALAAAKNMCPFKSTAEKIAQTTFLALSLISVAVSQLIVVIAATGLARDVNSRNFQEAMEKTDGMSSFEKFSMEISQNHKGIMYNITLVIISSLECMVAVIASYNSSRELCPCFRRNEDYYQDNLNMHRSHAIVSSWLMGKHGTSAAPQIYVVAGPPSSLGRGSNLSSNLPMPVYAFQTPLAQPQIVPYPLIPAPLGSVPSPIIMPPRKINKIQKVYKSRSKTKSRSRDPTPRRSRSKSQSKERKLTEEEVVQTYTGK